MIFIQNTRKISTIVHHPFGMGLPGRVRNAGNYRFGFNGKENIDEASGWQDYGMRIYNRKTARFTSIDPIASKYPELSTYQFASNSPISGVDLDGLEYFSAVNWANTNIANYSIPFMYDKNAPPTFKRLRQSNWKDVLNGTMYCATSTSLAYAQGNLKVADYLSENGFETNRISGQLEFFQKGGNFHSLIASKNYSQAQAGDLLFLQSTSEAGAMSGHVALLSSEAIEKGDTRIAGDIDALVPKGGYFMQMLTTNAGANTLNEDGTTAAQNTFGMAGYIVEQRADKSYYLKTKIVAFDIVKDKSGNITSYKLGASDMSSENLKVQGFGRVDENKIDPSTGK